MSDSIILQSAPINKHCSRCGVEKPITAFSKDRTCKNGLMARCKVCSAASNKAWREFNHERVKAQAQAWSKSNPEKAKAIKKAWYEANLEKAKARSKAWYEANLEKVKARNKARCEANPEKKKASDKAWRESNPEKSRAHSKAWQKANPERKKANFKAWCEANPEKVRASVHCRRARKLNAGGTHTAQQVKDLMEKQKRRCAYCKVSICKKYHADHIVALACGGTNDIRNIQLLCPTCNLAKHARDPIEFAQQLGLLL